MNVVWDLLYILVFPGFLFLIALGLAAEFVDRKLHARMQNRMGPPWFQPLADIIKLAAKDDLTLAGADTRMFRLVPLIALAAVVTAFLYIPVLGKQAPLAFTGDVIVVLYLLTVARPADLNKVDHTAIFSKSDDREVLAK